MRTLRFDRRRVRDLVLVLAAALSLVLNVGCRPPPNGPQIAKNHAWMQLNERGWIPQAQCLVNLWQAESGWNVYARNPSSGAYGIPQAYPANRMRFAGPDWRTNPATQVRWGLNYIKQRYGGPCNAWRHFQQRHWYLKVAPTGTAPSAPGSAPGEPAPTGTALTPVVPASRPADAPEVSN